MSKQKKQKVESRSFKFLWDMVGKDVVKAVRDGGVLFVPHKSIGSDYTPTEAARMLVQQEIDSLLWQIQDAVDWDVGRNLVENTPMNWTRQLFISCELLGLPNGDAAILGVAAYMAAIEWQKGAK